MFVLSIYYTNYEFILKKEGICEMRSKYIYIWKMEVYIQVHLNKLECRGKVHLFQ